MLKVKHWMTEVLLDVTSQEITKIAHSVYDKAKVQALKGRVFDYRGQMSQWEIVYMYMEREVLSVLVAVLI